ncbi:MAG: hypothetical protein ABIP97_12650, partial [Chthoniobacterales bacterium]
MVSISACNTAREKKRFENIPEIQHGKNPAFVPPFPGSIVKYISPEAPFNRMHGETLPFIAWRDGKPVGRIAAIVNRSHNTHYEDTTGFFGFFECEDNAETAKALLDKAASLLREKGLVSMRGPYNPSINDECGLLVQGDDTPPYIGLVWNPVYYEKLILGEGFSNVWTTYGFDLPLAKLTVPERLAKLANRVASRSSMKLRPIDLKKLKDDLKVIHIVYNDTLKRNWGSVPISLEDLYGAAEDMKAIADPTLVQIAEKEGKPAGVAMTLPNFNEILIKLKNTPHWLRLLHVFWLMKTYRIRSARQVVYGIVPEFRDRGLHAWLLFEQFVKAQERMEAAQLGW